METEQFDAELAETKDSTFPLTVEEMRDYLDRLAAAHAAEVDKYKVAWEEFSERTEWVQQTAKPNELGLHRADVLRLRIEQAEARAEAAERDARQAVGLLRECSARLTYYHPADIKLRERIDACMGEKAHNEQENCNVR